MASSNLQDDAVELFDDASHGWDITPTKPTIVTAEDVETIHALIHRQKSFVFILPVESFDSERLSDYFENVMYTFPVVLSSSSADNLEDKYLEAKRCADSFTQLRGVGWSLHNTLTWAKVRDGKDVSGTFPGEGKIWSLEFKLEMGNNFQAISVARDT